MDQDRVGTVAGGAVTTHDLERALNTLEGTEDRPIARRNARKRVLAELRKIRAAVDKEYPAIVSRKGVKRLTLQTRVARLKRAGWSIETHDRAAAFALEKVPTRFVDGVGHFVPNWAHAIGLADRSALRQAVKSRKHRLAALAAHALSL